MAAAGGCAAGKDQTLCARGRWESAEDSPYFAIQQEVTFGAIIFNERGFMSDDERKVDLDKRAATFH